MLRAPSSPVDALSSLQLIQGGGKLLKTPALDHQHILSEMHQGCMSASSTQLALVAYLGLYESVILQRRVRGSPPVNCGGVAVVGCDGS
jgi:hypothetical protein